MIRITIALVLLPALLLGQPKVTVSGFVHDELTGEALIGATVYHAPTRQGASTNAFGFYSITVPHADSLKLEVSFIGYQTKVYLVEGSGAESHNVQLTPGVAIERVTVTTRRSNVNRSDVGVVQLPMREVKVLPNLFGEVDIIKAYQLTPGVQSGGEAKSDLFVRGGSPDQNLIILDDVPLYYVAHFGGFFSIFNPDAINDTKLTKAGFPARYGGRLSSVLEVRMKEGNMQEACVQGTVGLLSSRLTVESPIIKDRMSFMVSGRSSLLPILRMMDAGLSYSFYDLNAKLNYRPTDRDRLFLSFYLGDDNLSTNEKSDLTQHTNAAKWGNTMGAFRWSRVYSSKLFGNLTLSSTNYRYRTNFEYQLSTDSISRELNNSLITGISDLSVKKDYSYNMNNWVRLNFGVNGIYHVFIPNDEFFSQAGTDIDTISESYTSHLEALENSAYLETLIDTRWLNANVGARYSTYAGGDFFYQSLEPRLSVNVKLQENLSAKYSYSTMNQYVHLLTYSGVGIPNDYWMPSNRNVEPQRSVQNSVGLARTLLNGMVEVSLEAYHKTLENMIAFKPGGSLLGNLDSWDKVVDTDGKGQNYGLELFIQKVEGVTTGWVSLTIAKAEREFANQNNGKPFPFKYDRLLDVSVVANHKFSDSFILSAAWNYGSGYPITLATQRYTIDGEEIFIYGDVNSFRMRDYHRLDVSASFPRETSWGERTWSVSIFNVYNRQNPYYYYYERKYVGTPTRDWQDSSEDYEALKLHQRSLFSFFPSFSYSFKF